MPGLVRRKKSLLRASDNFPKLIDDILQSYQYCVYRRVLLARRPGPVSGPVLQSTATHPEEEARAWTLPTLTGRAAGAAA
jgi:hypothetical protein